MSDLYFGGLPSSRAQDAPVPTQSSERVGQAGIVTPTQMMAARRARQAARQKQAQQEEDNISRRQPEDVVGVGADPMSTRQPTSRTAGGDVHQTARYPAGTSVTIGGRSENVPTSNGLTQRSGNTVVNQGQPRPVQPQAPQPQNAFTQLQENLNDPQVQRDRTEAYESLTMPAPTGRKPPQPQAPNYPQPSNSAQPSARAGFPHAFERWEDLSSEWEGICGYWIRRLQANATELEGKPIEKQMARQITDLSAAGANLFHAVVELQRLRASSERKFQRWFFDTRNDQEAAKEKIAELENVIRTEREQRTVNSSSIEAIEALQTAKDKADEMLREMRRELAISKEEARRAWEELGRREQEERERTIALRSGEPTSIGGVQVLPMQGLSSRHNTSSSNRPTTRDGPYPGGPTATLMGGQQPPQTASRSQTTLDSPTQEQAQFSSYQQPGATSPTDTDPFTETASAPPQGQQLRHEPDTQFYQTPERTQAVTSPAALAASRAVVSPTQSQLSRGAQPRVAATDMSTGPSYIASTRSGGGSSMGEDEYHTNPDGSLIRDAQGRPIPYRQPIGGYEEVASDDEDHTADIERERMLAQQYAQRQQRAVQPPRNPAHTPSSQAYVQAVSPARQPQTTTPEISPATQHTISPVTPQAPMLATMSGPHLSPDPADYEGSAYGPQPPTQNLNLNPADLNAAHQQTGWEAITSRHTHPTRLSDILEERTSPSRGSYVSGENDPGSRSIQGRR